MFQRQRKHKSAGRPAKIFILLLLIPILFESAPFMPEAAAEKRSEIKWVDFDIPSSLLKAAMELDIDSKGSATQIDWIEVLAYLGAKCGGDFKKHKNSTLSGLLSRLNSGESMETITEGMKYYSYYKEAYSAVLGGFLGEYEVPSQGGAEHHWETQYGLKAFFPIAKGFPFTHYDDFGQRRSYGYRRRHLGHDLMAQTGTPVVAVESGVIEELGWNQYGGWRIGIRSFDGLRYYYYAHLRQNRPYAAGLEAGGIVMAGDVVGYVGRTGYSASENTNGIKQSHLHLGMQLVFDEAEKEGANQIWIDLFELTRFLYENQSRTVRNSETKEHTRVDGFRVPVPDDRFFPAPKETRTADASLPEVDPETPVSVSLPVFMYHDILKDPKRQGLYTISPAQFEADLKYLAENGYQTVVVQDILDFVEKSVPLPEKPVMLSFDDGHFNNVYYAEPLLKEYGMRAVMFVVGNFTEKSTLEGEQNPNYSFVSWDEVRLMSERGVWDIQSHTWNLHSLKGGRKGVKRTRGETPEHHESLLREDFEHITTQIENVTGARPAAFAYPFGCRDGGAEHILKELGYKATFCSVEGKSVLSQGQPECLWGINRYLRTHRTSARTLLSK